MIKSANNQTAPLQFNPRDPAFRVNPYPTYDYLRTHHPIYYRPDKKDWLLTRYADIAQVLKNPNFGRGGQESIRLMNAFQEPKNHLLYLRQQSQNLIRLFLVLQNPPDHTRIRHLLHNTFTRARIQTLRSPSACPLGLSQLQRRVDNIIDRFQNRGKMDIINDLAHPLTLASNCEILGIPPQEWHPRFKQWSDNLSLMLDLDITSIANERGLLAIAGFAQYFRSLIAKWNSYSAPQDTLISTFIQAQAEGKLSEEELIANCIVMFLAGHSTTKSLIGTSILTLLNHPEQLKLLQADPSLIEMTISEVLRYDSTAQTVARTALSDVQLSNQTIHRGEIVNCIIAAANRDSAVFPEPDKFDIKRKPNPYLSFGLGIHNCIGKHLAKLVAEITIGTLVRRLPDLSLASSSLEWEETFVVRGLKSLPVVF